MNRLLKQIAFASLIAVFSFAVRADEEPQSPLGKEMEAMNRSFRKVRRQVADPTKKEANVALVAAMQENVKTAKTLKPPQSEKVPAAEHDKYMETFQKQLDELAKEYGVLKDLLVADNAEGATAEIKKISDLKEKSHKDLGVDLDKKK